MKRSRPILRYHGGKWKLAPWIIQHFPPHRVYIEPFGGAASVLLRKPRSYAEVYNDLDGELVNLFRVARDRGDELQSILALTPFARSEFELSYVPTSDSLEQARRTVTRAFLGFGSNAHNRATGFRNNSNRSGTTPAADWRNYPAALASTIERLQGVVLENRPAIDVMKQHDSPTTLHFVDPPYVSSTRDTGIDYRHEMTDDDHKLLALALNKMEGSVVVSGYRSNIYDVLFSGWLRVDCLAHADGARARVESLWLNAAAAERIAQPSLLEQSA